MDRDRMNRERKGRLKKYCAKFTQTVDPVALVVHFRKMADGTKERIIAITNNKGNTAGAVEFFSNVTKADSDWYDYLMEALENEGYTELLELLKDEETSSSQQSYSQTATPSTAHATRTGGNVQTSSPPPEGATNMNLPSQIPQRTQQSLNPLATTAISQSQHTASVQQREQEIVHYSTHKPPTTSLHSEQPQRVTVNPHPSSNRVQVPGISHSVSEYQQQVTQPIPESSPSEQLQNSEPEDLGRQESHEQKPKDPSASSQMYSGRADNAGMSISVEESGDQGSTTRRHALGAESSVTSNADLDRRKNSTRYASIANQSGSSASSDSYSTKKHSPQSKASIRESALVNQDVGSGSEKPMSSHRPGVTQDASETSQSGSSANGSSCSTKRHSPQLSSMERAPVNQNMRSRSECQGRSPRPGALHIYSNEQRRDDSERHFDTLLLVDTGGSLNVENEPPCNSLIEISNSYNIPASVAARNQEATEDSAVNPQNDLEGVIEEAQNGTGDEGDDEEEEREIEEDVVEQDIQVLEGANDNPPNDVEAVVGEAQVGNDRITNLRQTAASWGRALLDYFSTNNF